MRVLRSLPAIIFLAIFTTYSAAAAEPTRDLQPGFSDSANHAGGSQTPPPALVTPSMVEQSSRVRRTGEQVTPLASTWGNTQYWFSVTWSSGDSRLTDYTSWNFFKINGRSDLFYVEAVGSAYSHQYWELTRFEPWIRSNTSPARLVDWDPAGQVRASDGQTITFSLTYAGTGISTTFPASSDTYNPFPWSTHYSLEWRGRKTPYNTVANRYVTRWANGEPWGMEMANCGRGLFQWGNCSNR